MKTRVWRDIAIRNRYIMHAALSTTISLALIMTVYLVGISAVFAKDEELSSDVQVDILMKAAIIDIEADRWIGAVENLEKATNKTKRSIHAPNIM